MNLPQAPRARVLVKCRIVYLRWLMALSQRGLMSYNLQAVFSLPYKNTHFNEKHYSSYFSGTKDNWAVRIVESTDYVYFNWNLVELYA